MSFLLVSSSSCKATFHLVGPLAAMRSSGLFRCLSSRHSTPERCVDRTFVPVQHDSRSLFQSLQKSISFALQDDQYYNLARNLYRQGSISTRCADAIQTLADLQNSALDEFQLDIADFLAGSNLACNHVVISFFSQRHSSFVQRNKSFDQERVFQDGQLGTFYDCLAVPLRAEVFEIAKGYFGNDQKNNLAVKKSDIYISKNILQRFSTYEFGDNNSRQQMLSEVEADLLFRKVQESGGRAVLAVADVLHEVALPLPPPAAAAAALPPADRPEGGGGGQGGSPGRRMARLSVRLRYGGWLTDGPNLNWRVADLTLGDLPLPQYFYLLPHCIDDNQITSSSSDGSSSRGIIC